MSMRASLIYIMIGALLAGYVGAHWSLADEVQVTIERKWTGDTARRRFGTGTAHFVDTDQGTFGFMGTPFTVDSGEMYARLHEGESAKITVITWAHGPLLAGILDSVSRPVIIDVEP